MDGVINTKLNGMLANGKYFSRVRCSFLGDPFALFLCNSIGCPQWGKDVPEGIMVYKVGSTNLDYQSRDSLIIFSQLMTNPGRWQLKIEDYIHGGILDAYQMNGDLNAMLMFISLNMQSDFLDDHRLPQQKPEN